MQVSIIEPVGGHGGMNYYDMGLARGLAGAATQVSLFTCDINPPKSTNAYSVVTAFKGVYGKDAAWKRGLRYVAGLWRTLCTRGISSNTKVAHFHFFHVGPLELFSVMLARTFRYKVVVTAHDVEAFKAGLSVQWMVYRTYSLVHAVIAHNATSAAEVSTKLRVPSLKIHIIPHGNYLDSIGPLPSKTQAKSALGLNSSSGPIILFFGQIKEVKGLDVLLEAFGTFSQAHADAQLVIAGRVWKDDFSKYQDIIDNQNLASKVRLHIRYIADEEVANFYCAADLVVLPYRRIYQSGVLLMAMSYGTPVLTSDLSAMKEVVTHGETGFLFPEGNAQGLAEAMDHAFSSDQLRSTVAKNALTHMKKVFNWDTIGMQVATLYRSL